MAHLGFPIKAYQGVRTATQQWAEWEKGRLTPGPGVTPERPLGRTVTECDGVHVLSHHQLAKDGYGHAVDHCSAVGEAFPALFPWHLYGQAAKALGLKWGGDFPKIDLDHIELA